MMDFKPEPVQFTLLIYYCIINITAAVLTVTDKRRAQNLSPCCVSATKQNT